MHLSKYQMNLFLLFCLQIMFWLSERWSHRRASLNCLWFVTWLGCSNATFLASQHLYWWCWYFFTEISVGDPLIILINVAHSVALFPQKREEGASWCCICTGCFWLGYFQKVRVKKNLNNGRPVCNLTQKAPIISEFIWRYKYSHAAAVFTSRFLPIQHSP